MLFQIEMIGYSLTSFLHPSDIDDVFSRIQSLYEQINKGFYIIKLLNHADL